MSDTLFWRDDSPLPSTLTDHIVYLDINGHLILKHKDYQFSEGCMVRDGGMVVSKFMGIRPLTTQGIRRFLRGKYSYIKQYVTTDTWNDLDKLEEQFD